MAWALRALWSLDMSILMNQLMYISTLVGFSGHAALYEAVPPISGNKFVVIVSRDTKKEPFFNLVPETVMFSKQDLTNPLYAYNGLDHSGLAEAINYGIRLRDLTSLEKSSFHTKKSVRSA